VPTVGLGACERDVGREVASDEGREKVRGDRDERQRKRHACDDSLAQVSVDAASLRGKDSDRPSRREHGGEVGEGLTGRERLEHRPRRGERLLLHGGDRRAGDQLRPGWGAGMLGEVDPVREIAATAVELGRDARLAGERDGEPTGPKRKRRDGEPEPAQTPLEPGTGAGVPRGSGPPAFEVGRAEPLDVPQRPGRVEAPGELVHRR
jgi:hypothetical protein